MTQGVENRLKSRRRIEPPIALAVPSSGPMFISPRAFWRLCAANRDMRLERTAQEALIVMWPTGSESGRLNMNLSVQIGVWVKQDGSGVAFDSSAGFTLPNGAVRAPDVSWSFKPRWAALTRKQSQKFAPICPDFVAQLTSSSDFRADVHVKMKEYTEQGVRLGWLIDPVAVEVEIYRSGRLVELLKRPKTLSGEDVLPSFTLDL